MFIGTYSPPSTRSTRGKSLSRQGAKAPRKIFFEEGEILFSELGVFAGDILLYSLHSLWLRLSSNP
jgi:hypothetical protein